MIACAGLAFAAALSYWQSLLAAQEAEVRAARARSEVRVRQLSVAVEQQVDATVRGVDIALQHLRHVFLDDRAGFDLAVRNVVAAYPSGMLQFVTVFGADGYLAYSSGSSAGNPYFGDRPHFRVHADGQGDELFVSEPIIGRLAGVPLVQITRAIREGPRFRGVIGIPLRLDRLSENLASLRVDPADTLAILRANGQFIARSEKLQVALDTRVPANRPYLDREPGANGVFRAMASVDPRPMLFAWRRLATYPLVSVASIPEDAETGPIAARHGEERVRTLFVLALWIAFVTGVAWLIARIQWAREETGRSEERYRVLFERSRVPMLLVDPSTVAIVDGNAAAEAFYGHPRERLRLMPVAGIDGLAPAATLAEVARASEEGRESCHFEHRLAGGEIRQVEVHSGPLEIDGRELLHWVIHDITQRRAAERALSDQHAHLAALLETASDGIHILDEEGNLLQFSRSFAAMLGYEPQELRGLNITAWDALIPRERLAPMIRQVIREPMRFETAHRRRDGSVFDVEINAKGIEIAGRVLLYASSRDITARKQAEQQLRIAASAFETQEGIVITDADTVILRVNRAFTQITGYEPGDVVGRTTAMLNSGRHDAAFHDRLWESVRTRGHWQGEIWNRRKGGDAYPQWLSITAVRGEGGEVTNYVANFTDITMRKEAEEQIRSLAFFDPLTGLPNRRLLLDRVKQALAGMTRRRRPGALLFVDLDNFKTLNDAHGHSAGDELLRQVARRLQESVREGDTVARLGGDEFVVMLEDLGATDEEAAARAEAVGEKILAALSRGYDLAGQPHECTSSIGVALFGEREDSGEELLRRSDLAMYRAKAAGRNLMRFFDPQMQAAASARAALERQLRAALRGGQFELHYQPQVDERGNVTGAEGLVRWHHPERGMVAPGEFIPLAEETGLILPLGRWVLEQACRQLVAWSAQPAFAGLTVSVNVSARQFHQRDFVDQVRHALSSCGAEPRRLELELTESLLLDDVEAAIAKMSALREIGVRFSLDDFGTGHSSLFYLKRLPVDQLKIDQGFVRDVTIDPGDAMLVRTIMALATNLGIGAMAEGVETTAQRDFLLRHGCRAFQGYLFGRPVPAGNFGVARAGAAPRSASGLAGEA